MSYAFRCEINPEDRPHWRIERVGDAVVTWACLYHLSTVCERLQRDHEETVLTVKRIRMP